MIEEMVRVSLSDPTVLSLFGRELAELDHRRDAHNQSLILGIQSRRTTQFTAAGGPIDPDTLALAERIKQSRMIRRPEEAPGDA